MEWRVSSAMNSKNDSDFPLLDLKMIEITSTEYVEKVLVTRYRMVLVCKLASTAYFFVVSARTDKSLPCEHFAQRKCFSKK